MARQMIDIMADLRDDDSLRVVVFRGEGADFTAAAAEAYGIVNILTADADLEAETDKVVRRLASSPREAVRQTKALLKASLHRTFEEQFEAEREACATCAAHPDFPEALHAFIE